MRSTPRTHRTHRRSRRTTMVAASLLASTFGVGLLGAGSAYAQSGHRLQTGARTTTSIRERHESAALRATERVAGDPTSNDPQDSADTSPDPSANDEGATDTSSSDANDSADQSSTDPSANDEGPSDTPASDVNDSADQSSSLSPRAWCTARALRCPESR
jgi:hypothetical protein